MNPRTTSGNTDETKSSNTILRRSGPRRNLSNDFILSPLVLFCRNLLSMVWPESSWWLQGEASVGESGPHTGVRKPVERIIVGEERGHPLPLLLSQTFCPCVRDGQHDAYGRPRADCACQAERPMMLLYNTSADRQPQSRALPFWFGGKKCLHHLREMLRSNAHASVRKLDHDGGGACIERPCRHAEGQRTALGHSVAGVGEQIEEHLPQLLAVGGKQWHVRRVLPYRGNPVIAQVVVHEGQRVVDFFVDVCRRNLGVAATAELQQVC